MYGTNILKSMHMYLKQKTKFLEEEPDPESSKSQGFSQKLSIHFSIQAAESWIFWKVVYNSALYNVSSAIESIKKHFKLKVAGIHWHSRRT